jgi:O-antigen/teichoic acid export membrane protein
MPRAAARARRTPHADKKARRAMKTQFNRGSLVRSALMVTRATYVTYFTGLIISTITARSLDPDDYGRYSYVVWLSGLLIIACTNGLTITGIKFVAECLGREDASGAGRVYALMRRYFFASTVVATLVLAVALPFVRPAGWQYGWLFLAGIVLVSGLAKGLYLLHSSVAKGHGNFSVESNTTNLSGVLGVIATCVLAALHAPLAGYLLLFAALGIVHLLLARYALRKTPIHVEAGPVDAATVRRLRAHLAWTVLMVVLVTASNRTVETFLLNRTAGAEAVGFFIIAATLARGGADLLSSGLTAVLLPAMAHSYGQGGIGQVNRILSHAMRYFAFFGLLLAGAGAFCAALAVDLMYGAKYAPVAGVLQAMMVIAGLTLAEGAVNAVLITIDQQRLRVMLTVAAVAVSAALAFVLVPRYGLAGAVAGHVAARAVVFVTGLALTSLQLRMRLPWRDLGKLATAAAIAALVAWGVLQLDANRWMGLAAAMVYAAVFGAGALLLGAWQREDLAMFAALSERYPRVGLMMARLGLR